MIKPIETNYNGHRFRSRLEARVAVLFDKLNMKYEYESEGFELNNGIKYLPDFYLPEEDLYVEVKPQREGAAEELEKVICFVKESHKCVVVISEIPNPSASCIWWYPVFWYQSLNIEVNLSRIALSNHDNGYFIRDFSVTYDARNVALFNCCYYFTKRFKNSFLEPKTDAWMYRNNDDLSYEESFTKEELKPLFYAYQAARQARFEHGEKPII